MKRSPNLSLLLIVGVITLGMAVYVYIVGQFTKGPFLPSPVGQIQQQDRTPATEQPPAQSQTSMQVPAPALISTNTAQLGGGEEVKTWIGIYTGRIDNNFIEIKVGDEARTFLAPVELIGGALNKDDPVLFDFYKNSSGQLVFVSFKKMAPAAGKS
jgi:hypothetical protein